MRTLSHQGRRCDKGEVEREDSDFVTLSGMLGGPKSDSKCECTFDTLERLIKKKGNSNKRTHVVRVRPFSTIQAVGDSKSEAKGSEEGLFSFAGSSANLRANNRSEDEETIARVGKAAAFAHVRDEVKPLFFFNIKPKQEDENGQIGSDFSTPGFSGVLTISDSLASINAEAASSIQRNVPRVGNTQIVVGTNIFIRNTTIVNSKRT